MPTRHDVLRQASGEITSTDPLVLFLFHLMRMMRDENGVEYFIYGQELGGGLYGEDADVRFMTVGKTYLITSYWKSHRQPDDQSRDSFFMGAPRRVKTISLISGRKPGTARRKKQMAKIKAHEKKRAARGKA